MIKYIFIFVLFFVSCSSSIQKKDLVSNKNLKDTIITYNLEGISIEGAEVKVSYKASKILNSKTILYGETGKAIIFYDFDTQKIKVIEKYYLYKKSLENVESDDDIEFIKEQSYYIDYNGSVIGRPIEDRIDIFKEFKDKIPFNIK